MTLKQTKKPSIRNHTRLIYNIKANKQTNHQTVFTRDYYIILKQTKKPSNRRLTDYYIILKQTKKPSNRSHTINI